MIINCINDMDMTSSDYLGHDASNLVSAVGLDGKPIKETTFKVHLQALEIST